jgi:hypothetical protein
MNDEPQATVFPGGLKPEFPNGPPTVVITDRGCQLVLRFAAGDVMGEGPVQELRLLPDTETLEPKVLRRFAPQADLYLAYARSAMRIFKEGAEDYRAAAQALRDVQGPGRGLSPEFYRLVAKTYDALIAGGEQHPVKALSEKHHVTISAASRWLKEARRRGLIQEEARDAS